MNRIHTLIVDDSVVIRSLLRQVLTHEPDIEVVGTAANGRIALQMVDQVTPDVVTMDIEMPEMNGLDALRAIRTTHPRLPVIMFSTLTERGAVATLEAFSLGASDYVTKPSNTRPGGEGVRSIRDQLVPKIRALCRRERPGATSFPHKSLPIGLPIASSSIRAVAIGTSTGGPNALSVVLPRIPRDFPVPIFIVQHMPPMFTRFLAERLNRECLLPVSEAKNGEQVHPGQVWIAPGDCHLTVENQGTNFQLRTSHGPPENSCRPAVDVLFRSVAKVYGAGLLGVIMTGMGQDGLRGCHTIREAGGTVLVQDEATSVVWGMPGYVSNAGLAERVLALNQIGEEIVNRVTRKAVGRGA